MSCHVVVIPNARSGMGWTGILYEGEGAMWFGSGPGAGQGRQGKGQMMIFQYAISTEGRLLRAQQEANGNWR